MCLRINKNLTKELQVGPVKIKVYKLLLRVRDEGGTSKRLLAPIQYRKSNVFEYEAGANKAIFPEKDTYLERGYAVYGLHVALKRDKLDSVVEWYEQAWGTDERRRLRVVEFTADVEDLIGAGDFLSCVGDTIAVSNNQAAFRALKLTKTEYNKAIAE